MLADARASRTPPTDGRKPVHPYMTIPFPKILRVRQRFPGPTIDNVESATLEALSGLQIAGRIQSGDSVAITAGSRGISNIANIIRAIATYCDDAGGKPFIVPAMGSHGGGTAEGQTQVLAAYGITEEFCGCPIRASMETVLIGEAVEGFPIYLDKFAQQADHVVICNRIKPHTNFSGDVQSGLMKMMMIGLGKKDGASLYHHAIFDHGFPSIIRSVAPQVVKHANILCGVAIVENGIDETARIEAVEPADFESREKELLELAREWMPSLPFDEIDLLLLDRIGKNISGTGMDTNVIGRKHSEPEIGPRVRRIAVRGLTKETHGNAAGIGFADFCLSRVIDEMDRDATILNCLTALDIDAGKTPLQYPTDQEMVESALSTLGLTPSQQARLVWIRDTGHIEEFWCSEAFSAEIERNERLSIVDGPVDFAWSGEGMLADE